MRVDSLPPEWEQCISETTGRIFYKLGDLTQWLPPGMFNFKGPALDQPAFAGAFWEMLDAVHRRWGQALAQQGRASGSERKMLEDYFFGKPWSKLGSGSYGSVYRAKHRRTGLLRAVKEIPLEDAEGSPERLDSEIGRLALLDHPNIVKCYDYYEGSKFVYLVMDYCSGGDLSGHCKRLQAAKKILAEPVLASLIRQILMAVAHIHARGLLHLDLKPGNVVVVPEFGTMPPARGADPQQADAALLEPGRNAHVMLIDLGLARIFRPGHFAGKCIKGTPATMAPEAWKGVETPASDVFGCGATFFHLLTYKYPFPGTPLQSKMAVKWWAKRPAHIPYTTTEHSEAARNLCDSMLQYERLSRPTATTCLAHPFFAAAQATKKMAPQVTQRLQRLAKAPERSVLYRSVALSIAAAWPANRLPSIRKAFQDLDVAGTGRLSRTQIVSALVALGTDPELARKAADAMDLTRNGMVDWTEFVASCIHLGSETLDADLQRIFEEADADGDGHLDRKELERLLSAEHLRGQVTDDVMQDLVGKRGPKAKVDWPTFRRHFCSISRDVRAK